MENAMHFRSPTKWFKKLTVSLKLILSIFCNRGETRWRSEQDSRVRQEQLITQTTFYNSAEDCSGLFFEILPSCRKNCCTTETKCFAKIIFKRKNSFLATRNALSVADHIFKEIPYVGGPPDHPPSQHTMRLLLYWCCNSTTGSMIQIKLNVGHLQRQFSCCQRHICKQQPEHSKQMEVCLFWAYQSLKPQHASHTETECKIIEMDHWSTAGECCVTVTQLCENKIWNENYQRKRDAVKLFLSIHFTPWGLDYCFTQVIK